MLVGHAGMGKTRLLGAAVEAAARELRVVRAAGAELEQNLAFGVAGQLLRSLLSEVSPSQRRALLADAPQRVLMLEHADPGQDGSHPVDHLAVSHGLFTVLAGVVESSPALLAIDAGVDLRVARVTGAPGLRRFAEPLLGPPSAPARGQTRPGSAAPPSWVTNARGGRAFVTSSAATALRCDVCRPRKPRPRYFKNPS